MWTLKFMMELIEISFSTKKIFFLIYSFKKINIFFTLIFNNKYYYILENTYLINKFLIYKIKFI